MKFRFTVFSFVLLTFAMFASAQQDAAAVEACITSQTGECTVQINNWTVEVENDPIEGRNVWVSGSPKQQHRNFRGKDAGDIVFRCLNGRFSVYLKATSILSGYSARAVWKYENGPTHDRQLWDTDRGWNFVYFWAPASSRGTILEEGRIASGDLTVRVWTLFTEDNVYSTEGLPTALRAIHCA